MRSVGLDEPLFMRSGEGAFIEDVNGNRYVDWVLSWGPLLFGHADPTTLAAVAEALARGTTFGAPTEGEVDLAAEIVDAVPSVEMVRLVSSGTEAAMSTVRLARAATRRDRVIKFAGNYHGHVDALLASGGSGLMTLGIPSTPGVPTGVAADTIVLPVQRHRRRRRGRGASTARASPRSSSSRSPGNMGVVPPAPGFLEALRLLCDASGALLVFDEVITGFRVARGGAQERFGVMPDLTILGKIVGGGLPAAAFGGRAELMERLAPVGDVYQAGTLSGNPLATAAGTSVLRRLRDPEVYEELERRGARLEAGLAPFGTVQRVGAMLTLFCQDDPVRDYDDAVRSDTERYGALFRHLLERGIYVAPSQFECMFVSLAHGDEEIDGRSRPLATSSTAEPDVWETLAAEAAAESPLWAESLRPAERARDRARLLAALRAGVRARGGDDLRGLPAPLRPAAALRAGRRRHGAPARRLPLRPRARPDRGDRAASRRCTTSPS